MSAAWLNFATVIIIQLLLFAVLAYFFEKKLSYLPRILGRSALIGLVFGLLFDLVLGKSFGINSYMFGFSAFFLTLNGTLSYGLFAASILLLRHIRLSYFCILIILMMVVYEITNHLFPVWIWEFAFPPIQFLATLSVGYLGGAILIAFIWHHILGERFFFIDNWR